jgi:hypothetical protein
MAGEKVAKIGIEINSNIAGAIKGFSTLSNSLKTTETNSKQATYSLQKLSGSLGNLKSIFLTQFGFGSMQQSIQTIAKAFTLGYQESSKFIENYNLFNVSMQGNTAKALEFQYELNRAFKTNMSETLRYQGFFENLANSLGITSKESQVLSENLTKLTYDISSLFNIDVATAYSKLSSGLVGQTKPLRGLGIDVTMQTLQTDLDRLGIQAQVGQLTQAEKVLLRYIAILRQSTNAQGDFSRTIETPVNQFRIFTAQTQELTRWFGTLFLGAITKVLPYINAVVIGLKEIFMTFSTIMGFDINDFNFLGGDNGMGQIEDGIDGVDGSVKKLTKSLMGFDEINNLSSSDSEGLLGSGSYYDQLAEYIKGYENGMENVSLKADEIKNKIYGWLGLFENNEGKIIALDGTFADFVATVATFAWAELKNFFTSAGIFVNDVAQWFKDNPEWGNFVIVAFTGTAILIAGARLLAMATPLGALVVAGIWFVANYSKIKDFWKALTPEEKLLTTLGLLAIAVAGVVVAATAGVGTAGIIGGWAAIGATALLAVGIASDVAPKGGKLDEPLNNTGGGHWGGKGSTYSPDPTKDTSWVKQYASGGFPNSGQMFYANENGNAEMVGSIGGRTAVANNQQIVSAVSQGVAMAVSSVIGSGGSNTVNIYLDDVLTGTAIINSINRATKVTGNTVMQG